MSYFSGSNSTAVRRNGVASREQQDQRVLSSVRKNRVAVAAQKAQRTGRGIAQATPKKPYLRVLQMICAADVGSCEVRPPGLTRSAVVPFPAGSVRLSGPLLPTVPPLGTDRADAQTAAVVLQDDRELVVTFGHGPPMMPLPIARRASLHSERDEPVAHVVGGNGNLHLVTGQHSDVIRLQSAR